MNKRVTIKDVAAAANVSVGSVSNVLNGRTTNKELCCKVEAAIKKLGFVPQAIGRNLKKSSSHLIGLITDNFTDSGCAYGITGLYEILAPKKYQLIVNKSEGSNAYIAGAITAMQAYGVDGIIINNATPCDMAELSSKFNVLPIVHTGSFSAALQDIDILNTDYVPACKKLFIWAESQGYKKPACLLDVSQLSNPELLSFLNDKKVLIYKASKPNQDESFKLACAFLNTQNPPDLLLIGSRKMAMGVNKAIKLCFPELDGKIDFVCIKRPEWTTDENLYRGIIYVSDYDIGHTAGKILLNRIEKGTPSGSINTLKAEFKLINSKFTPKLKSTKQNTLKLALLDTENLPAISNVFNDFTNATGVKVHIEKLKYYELWSALMHTKTSNFKYDIFSYDIMWKKLLCHAGKLMDLNSLPKHLKPNTTSFVPDIIRAFGGDDFGHLWGLPFLNSTQILFYQKHLFNDDNLKRNFKSQYGYNLTPPTNWISFNQIAEFFTQAFNKDSPVKYGVGVINAGNLYSSIEFLNRFWSFGGRVLINEQQSIDRRVLIDSLTSYAQSYKYSFTNNTISSWEDLAAQMRKGDTAMAILYDSLAYGLNDPMHSSIAGDIGTAIIPGRSPALGGWGIGISAYNKYPEIAAEFMSWLCQDNISYALSVITGVSANKNFVNNTDLTTMYPWINLIQESYALSRDRELFPSHTDENLELYNKIIGGALGEMLKGTLSIEETADLIIKKVTELSIKCRN